MQVFKLTPSRIVFEVENQRDRDSLSKLLPLLERFAIEDIGFGELEELLREYWTE